MSSLAALAFGSVQAAVVERAATACPGNSWWSGWEQSCKCETGKMLGGSGCDYPALPQQNCDANADQSLYCAQDPANYCAYDSNHAFCKNNGKNIAFCSNTNTVENSVNQFWNTGVIINNE